MDCSVPGLACLSLTPRACSKSCPSSWLFHPKISSSVIPFSSCLQSFPALGSFLMSQFFTSGGQSIGASYILLNKRSQSEKATYCVIPAIISSGKGKTMETTEKIWFCWGLNRQSTEDFYNSENIVCDIIMVDTCHSIFQTHRIYNTKIKKP